MARDDAWIAGIDPSVLWSVDRRSAAASVMLKQVSKKGERVRVVSGRTTIRPAVVWRVLAVGLVRRFRHASVAGNESAGTRREDQFKNMGSVSPVSVSKSTYPRAGGDQRPPLHP